MGVENSEKRIGEFIGAHIAGGIAQSRAGRLQGIDWIATDTNQISRASRERTVVDADQVVPS
jgi:hypothetical protein